MHRNIHRRFFTTYKQRSHIYFSNSTDAGFNNSIETWLVNKKNNPMHILYIWNNAPSVIIGRNQNPYKECNIQNMKKDRIQCYRRKSGGGAVVHDLGNTNFSIISDINSYNRELNYGIIIRALETFGIKPYVKGKNDIELDGRKISGSAYQVTNNSGIHHGTLLLNLDMSLLQKYLNPNKKKLQSKGIESVQARVMNLSEIIPSINHKNVKLAIMKEFIKTHGNNYQVIHLNEKLKTNKVFAKIYNEYTSWDWVFGNCPTFKYSIDNRFHWGTVEVNFTCELGILNNIQIYSDSLYPIMINLLNSHLIKKKYSVEGIADACVSVCNQLDVHYELTLTDKDACKKYVNEFCGWFSSTI